MTNAWPWLVVAGIGALHGLNPAAGWMIAAARGVRSNDPAQALRALGPIAAGHAASIALVAGAVALGVALDRGALQGIAGGLGVVAALAWLSGRLSGAAQASASRAGLALCSFATSTAHGVGMMLVPALAPLCVADSPAREITASGSIALALAAVALHTAAMLAVTGAVALLACRGVHLGGHGVRRWRRKRRSTTA